MRLRLTKVDEYQFLTCLKSSLWGSKTSRFKEWQKGDFLVFIVNKTLAGLAEVSGTPFYDTAPVWDNGVFPHRIPIKFVHIPRKEQRVPVLGEVRDALTNAWGPSYGWGIITQSILPEKQAEIVVNAISSNSNSLSELKSELPVLLTEAKQERDLSLKPKVKPKEKHEEKIHPTQELETKEEESLHSQVENALIKLGNATGCSVCIAANDKNRLYQGKPLGEECLKSLPNFGLNEEAVRRISLIDVIWTLRNSPVCAFEVETTTSIYSGLLRMSDLLSVVPSLKISLYIVATKSRQDRVRSELTRPTFQKIGLNEYCKFIPIEELNKLLKRVEGLQGHIQSTIIDTIATGFEEEAM